METLLIGIDLGTTNSVLAFGRADNGSAEVLSVPQAIGQGQVAPRRVLPSALYLPESGDAGVSLPWCKVPKVGDPIAGGWARRRSREVPERVITSAKSWLSSSHVDRRGAILPWRSDVAGKLSPVAASAHYLAHLHGALSEQHPFHPDSKVVLTVPASFDEVARQLTLEAAAEAGWQNVSLLEEPQAAFYAWIASHPHWRSNVAPGDVVLVCDCGGGTTDFSLILVGEAQGELVLERIAVGDHLLLGGDNMDLALAYVVQQEFARTGVTLDRWQLQALLETTREAKETLLSGTEHPSVPIAVAGRGSSLMGSVRRCELTRDQVLDTIVAGFFPLLDFLTAAEAAPRPGLALQELGLRYEGEPAVSKHLARFLRRARANAIALGMEDRIIGLKDRPGLFPTKVLFNGGVFTAPALRERVQELLSLWHPEAPAVVLPHADLECAVALGAHHFGEIRHRGAGLRIATGTSRSYYLGLEPTGLAVPHIRPQVKGLCVVPFGTDEGTELPMLEQQFGLLTGQEAQFRFFSASTRPGDVVGTIVADAEHELEETAQLRVFLDAVGITAATQPGDDGRTISHEDQWVPVRLGGCISDVGTLQLYLQHTESAQRWNLEFDVRHP